MLANVAATRKNARLDIFAFQEGVHCKGVSDVQERQGDTVKHPDVLYRRNSWRSVAQTHSKSEADDPADVSAQPSQLAHAMARARRLHESTA